MFLLVCLVSCYTVNVFLTNNYLIWASSHFKTTRVEVRLCVGHAGGLEAMCDSDEASTVSVHLINSIFIITVKLQNMYL